VQAHSSDGNSSDGNTTARESERQKRDVGAVITP
jgi:hypothetical protein